MPVSTPCLLEDLSVKYYHFINTCISFYPTELNCKCTCQRQISSIVDILMFHGKNLKTCKSMNIWLLFVPCEAVFYLNCFKHHWATQYITIKHKFHIIWLYFMSRKRTLKQSISAQCWGHPRDFEEQGNKAMYYRVTREDESKTRGPRVTTHSPEWHSYFRYAPVMQHFPILSLQLMKGWSIKQFLVLKKDTWPWQSMKRDHLDKLSIIFH